MKNNKVMRAKQEDAVRRPYPPEKKAAEIVNFFLEKHQSKIKKNQFIRQNI